MPILDLEKEKKDDKFSQFNLPTPSSDFDSNDDVLSSMALGTVTHNMEIFGGKMQASELRTQIESQPSAAAIKTFIMGGQGIFTFGDGNDGDVTISADTTLSADRYYKNLTVDATFVLSPAGYRIFVSEKLVVAGTIRRNGNDGGTGGNASVGTGGSGGGGGAALAAGYLATTVAGVAGGNGGTDAADGANSTGTNVSNSLGSNGSAGGAGGRSINSANTSTSTGGTATASNVELIANWHLATLLDIGATGATLKFTPSAGAAGGGGGRGDLNSGGGGGGGAASGGGIVAIYAKEIEVRPTGAIQSNGGVGGNGGNGAGGANGGGGGGGGAGGDGGQIILVYNTYSNAGSVVASGGTFGTGGANGGAPATDGSVGTAGSAGTVREFKISL